MLSNRENRSAAGSSSTQTKFKLSSRSIPLVAAIIALCWCIFIGMRHQQKFDVNRLVRSLKASNIIISANVVIAKPLELIAPVHVVFSTDCTFFQDWQSLLVFHSATAVGQEGNITRIASGCSIEKQASLIDLYAKLFPRYNVHFTPDFKMDKKTKKEYDFYNKPYGMDHWLNNAVPAIEDNTVIALIDPDMIFLRPLTAYVRDTNMLPLRDANHIPNIVEKGAPVSQLYGIGAPWATESPSRDFDKKHICGENSPCLNVKQHDGEQQYR